MPWRRCLRKRRDFSGAFWRPGKCASLAVQVENFTAKLEQSPQNPERLTGLLASVAMPRKLLKAPLPLASIVHTQDFSRPRKKLALSFSNFSGPEICYS